jgi:hypothetical protein
LTHSQKEFLNTQLKRIAGAWKSFDTKVNAPIYAQELKVMLAECGETRVDRGITKAIRNHLEFVPSVAELWQYVRSAGAGGTLNHPYPCELCGNTGWAEATITSNLTGKVRRAVKRCPNWRIE